MQRQVSCERFWGSLSQTANQKRRWCLKKKAPTLTFHLLVLTWTVPYLIDVTWKSFPGYSTDSHLSFHPLAQPKLSKLAQGRLEPLFHLDEICPDFTAGFLIQYRSDFSMLLRANKHFRQRDAFLVVDE